MKTDETITQSSKLHKYNIKYDKSEWRLTDETTEGLIKSSKNKREVVTYAVSSLVGSRSLLSVFKMNTDIQYQLHFPRKNAKL